MFIKSRTEECAQIWRALDPTLGLEKLCRVESFGEVVLRRLDNRDSEKDALRDAHPRPNLEVSDVGLTGESESD